MAKFTGLNQQGNQAMLRQAGIKEPDSTGEYGDYAPPVIRALRQIEEKNKVPMTGVDIHFNSSFPAQMNATGTALGGYRVDLAPGQEQCMHHEFGHIVQQRLGLVKADKTINGRPVCTRGDLEEDASRRGMV